MVALPPEPPTEIIAENRWVAQRYGVLAFFGDATREDGRVDIDDLVTDLVEELASDARALGCEAETRRALAIIREGTSAGRQHRSHGPMKTSKTSIRGLVES